MEKSCIVWIDLYTVKDMRGPLEEYVKVFNGYQQVLLRMKIHFSTLSLLTASGVPFLEFFIFSFGREGLPRYI